ncbi:hypothetical protein [Brevibacillus sp. NRS-1366]|uniref:hypothetical protein n=1 Tax=Brevibacillus sp. NRS-1366 TaxID=3233899 RepID=UPI003D24B827
MFMYLFLTWAFHFRRAVKLEVKLINNKTKKNETELHDSSQEKEKTIKIGFTLERRVSIFSLLARLLIKRGKLYIKVTSNSDDLLLIAKNKAELIEVIDELDGFSIDITEQINKSLSIGIAFPHEKNYEFVVSTKRGINKTPERKVLVYTNIMFEKKRAGFLFKSLFEVHDGKHTVEIFP